MRPALRYHGGKWVLAPWIIKHFPPHRVYVEPFGGGASVLLRKPRCYAEVYNDLDGEVVNVFRQLRDNGAALAELLKLTPFAREEYALSLVGGIAPLEAARLTIARSFMGFGSDVITNKNSGFRSNSNRSHTTPAHDWANYADACQFLVARLRGVVIENRDYWEVMKQHDSPDTLFYVDPPYMHETRSSSKRYAHEMTTAQHENLVARLCHGLRGKVVVSGYESPLYSRAFRDWARYVRPAMADGARPRKEVLWCNFHDNRLF